MFARRTRGEVHDPATSQLRLRDLVTGEMTTYSFFAEPPIGGEVFEVVAQVRGAWREPPGFAIFADWQVDEPAYCRAFEESRLTLFALRQQAIPSFHTDWLMRRPDLPGRYLVLGLYGERDGLQASREHPTIVTWASEHSADALTARDLHGARQYEIAEISRGTLLDP